LLNQTKKIESIWILQCQKHTDIQPILDKYASQNFKYIYSDINFKYFGRFMLPNFITTEYTIIIDDDVIPGHCWIENAIRASTTYNAVVGCVGRIIPESALSDPNSCQLKAEYMIGDADLNKRNTTWCEKDTVVDYLCNSFLFKTEWIKYFWAIPPLTYENGEDIHLSATCQILGGIKSVVPIQNSNDLSGNLKPGYGFDCHASFLHKKDFFSQRQKIQEYLISQNKWQTHNKIAH
jgi:hypothetical protein